MLLRVPFAVCLVPALFTVVAAGQTTTAPVAYVYVSNIASSNVPAAIRGYYAAPNGQLTAIPGSPFRDSVTSMAVNGKYMFAVNQNFLYLDTLLINSNGSLKKITSLNDDTATHTSCTDVQQVLLDHSGGNLYVGAGDYGCNQAPAEESLLVNRYTGALSFLSTIGPNRYQPYVTTFTANNVYGYGAACDAFGSSVFLAAKRGSNGSLVPISARTPSPAAPQGDTFCPSLPQGDPYTHLAIAESGFNLAANGPTGNPDQIASYTVDSSGNLSTTSTYANMPKSAVLHINDMSMSPSGKLLAVGGTAGLQVFHFNGGAPVTLDTGLLTRNAITHLYWDKANHLYAISYSSQRLFVFTVTPTSAAQAPGSPYSITNPSNLIVQPK